VVSAGGDVHKLGLGADTRRIVLAADGFGLLDIAAALEHVGLNLHGVIHTVDGQAVLVGAVGGVGTADAKLAPVIEPVSPDGVVGTQGQGVAAAGGNLGGRQSGVVGPLPLGIGHLTLGLRLVA